VERAWRSSEGRPEAARADVIQVSARRAFVKHRRRVILSSSGIRFPRRNKEFGMSLNGHIAELTRRHQVIDKQIETEKARPATDPVKLTELKRKKLQLKDEMTKLQH